MEKPHGESPDSTGPNSSFRAPKISNPFETPSSQSRPETIISSAEISYSVSGMSHILLSILFGLRISTKAVVGSARPPRQRKFKSARLIGTYDKPWTLKRDPRMVWDKFFFWGLATVGLGIGAYLIYTGWASVENPPVSALTLFSLLQMLIHI
jgi:hypothetical protein